MSSLPPCLSVQQVNMFLYLTFHVLIYLFVFYPKLVSVLCYLIFDVLTRIFPLDFQKVIFSLSFNFFCILTFAFCMLQQTLSKLQSFVGKVWLLLSHFTQFVLIYTQWRLSISNKNAHHTMIGTFLLSASILLSNI